jgi:phage terminase large subunit
MKIYADEILYQKGLTNSDIANYLKSMGYGGQPVICDSAEPKSIFELRQYGINAHSADKKPGSVNAGIDFLRRADVFVTPRSENIVRENKLYRWKQDKEGVFINQPIDAFNHGIDALRYACSLFEIWKPESPYVSLDEL